ncbi:MAG: hypothetical protein K2O78_04195 [Muribaculaceae bacterium]|nr:hypothetical protein [Muribaculaceae bacterium]
MIFPQIPRRIGALPIAFAALTTAGFLTLPVEASTGGAPTLPGLSAADSTTLSPDEAARRRLAEQSKVIFINGDEGSRAPRDSVESMIMRFYANQFRNSQDPEAPYFTFMSKDANLAMGIGGVIKVRGYFDWAGMVDGGSFCTALIEPRTATTRRNLGSSVAGTTIFFTIMGRNTPLGTYQAYIEGGFNGYQNSGFKLKKAWFQWNDFTIGLATTTFSDPAAQPDLLDGAGANGKIDRSNVLLRYLRTFHNHWSVGGSVEFPSSQIQTDDRLTQKCHDYVPEFAALGQYQWDRGQSHVRLAGIVRTMAYVDLPANRTCHNTGWGVQLSAVVRAGQYMKFFTQNSVGQGIGSYTGDLAAGNYDLLPMPADEGQLYAPWTVTSTVGAKAYWMPNLTSTFAVATLRHFPRSGAAPDVYKYGQYLAVNLIYDFTERVQLGVEYLAGKRKNAGGTSVNANRAQAVFTLAF